VRRLALFTLLLPLLAPYGAYGVASPWAANEQSRVRLVTPWRVAPGSGELRLGLHFTLAPGWHVYWKNSGDAGFPPVVVFRKTPGLGGTELLWPSPARFELPGDLVAFGYEDEVVYPILASVSSQADRLHLEADVDYLVCEVDCIPYRYTLAVDQPLGSPVPDPQTAALIDRWWGRLPTPADRLPGVTTDAALDVSRPDRPVLEVRVRGARAGAGSGLFLESHEAFDTGRPEARPTGDGVLYRVPLKPREVGPEGGKVPFTTRIGWTVTGLEHDGRPLSLEARREVGRKAAPAAVSVPRPGLTILLAVASALLALGLWLGPALPASHTRARLAREALGFAAATVTVGLLYALSRQVRPEGLAAVELALLALGLCAWLRHRSTGSQA
jgi:DsbC/DsbD-like thiol-disulfide interchange protein